MNQKIHVSHVILYSLYLLQTIATFLFLYASEAVSNVAMYVFCPAVMLMFWYEIGSLDLADGYHCHSLSLACWSFGEERFEGSK